MILLGTAAFFLMLLGDVNDALWHRSALRLCFPVGLILLAAATAARLSLEAFDTAWCAVAAAFLLVLLYALFGSFSVKDAYVSQEFGRRVYDKGFYALCRHPGVLFLRGFMSRSTMPLRCRGRMPRCTRCSTCFLRRWRTSGSFRSRSADMTSIKRVFRF